MYSNAVNSVFNVLTAANVSGQPLDFLKSIYFGEATPRVTTLAKPYLIVSLDDPAASEDWVASKDRRGGTFTIIVVITAGIQDPARPFGLKGDATKRGIVTIAEDVMNQLDNDRATILAADPSKLIDMNLALRGPRPMGEGVWEATVAVIIRPRFTAGQR